MAEKYFPFNSVMGDREYLAEDFAAYFSDLLSSGISANGNNLGVTSAGGLNLSVSSGIALIQGRQYQNTATITLTVAPGAATPRIDRVVARLDVAARKILLAIVSGTPSSTPTPPALTRNNDYYEIGLANVSVPASAISISAANITDTRTDSSVCGVVRCLIEKLDVSAFMQNSQTAFDEWFSSVKNVLDESTAGNLLNLINAHTGNTGIHVTATEKTRIANAVQSSDVVTTAAANKLLRLNGSGLLPAGITGNAATATTATTATTAQNTSSIAGALTVSTAAPGSTLGAGKLWGRYG